ncbi:MAG: hypothetical protein ABJP34_10635 [Erythrobacter sp.]
MTNAYYAYDRKNLLAEDAKKIAEEADKQARSKAKALKAENDRRLRAGLPLVKFAKALTDRKMVLAATARPDDFRRGPAFDADVKAGKIFSAKIDGKLHIDAEEAALAALSGKANVF